MKKTVLLLLLAMLSLPAFSQQIISNNKHDINDLKKDVLNYTKIMVHPAPFGIQVNVGIDSGGIWCFYNSETQKPMKFKTDIQVLDYMYKYGWKLMFRSPDSHSAMIVYYFEKDHP